MNNMEEHELLQAADNYADKILNKKIGTNKQLREENDKTAIALALMYVSGYQAGLKESIERVKSIFK